MSDQKRDVQPLDAGTAAPGTPYPSRVRSLLGMPRQSFIAEPVRLPPYLDPLTSPDSPAEPRTARGPSDMDNRVGPSAIEAPALPHHTPVSGEEGSASTAPRSSAETTGARDLSEADRGAISTPGPAGVERIARETLEPALDEPKINESEINRLGLERPSHRKPPRDRPALDLMEEHAPSVGTSGEATRAGATGEPMTVEHVHVAIPGAQSEKKIPPVVETLSPQVTAAPADVGTVNEAEEVETPTLSARVPRSQTIPDWHDAQIPDPRAQEAQPASTPSPRPEARLSEEETAASAPSRSDGSRLLIPSREPRDHAPAEGERPRRASVQSRHVRAGLEYEGDHGVDDAAPLPSEGIRVGPAAAPLLRAQTIENLVDVPVREARGLEQLQQKVEHLEARVEQQRARLRQAARPESRAAPRFVFVTDRPATSPRAYWARSHLTRVTLWPRR